MMTSTVVGYRQFKSKKGTDCNVLVLLTDFTPAENSRGCYGKGAQEVFLNDETAAKVTPDNSIGKQVSLVYTFGASGRPYLDDVEFVDK